MLPSRYFIDLTQPEIAAQFKKNPLVILPRGSVEQHGPHLPTGTDIFAANVIAHAVAERMDGLVLPGGPLGVTPMHMPFEGTITLTPDTYMRVVTETCVSTAKHGAKYLLILNWHEGNIPLARDRRRDAAPRPRHDRAHRAGLLRRRRALRPRMRRADPRRRDRGARGARLPAGPGAPRPHRLLLRPLARPQDGQAAPHAQLPAGADRHPHHRADRLVRQSAARHGGKGHSACWTTSPTRSPRKRPRSSASSTRPRAASREIKQLSKVR